MYLMICYLLNKLYAYNVYIINTQVFREIICYYFYANLTEYIL